MYGYIPETGVVWFGENRTDIQSDTKYSIDERKGNRMAQTGEPMPGPSLLSVLTIKNPQVADSGTYYCETRETSVGIELTVTEDGWYNYI